MLFLHEKRLWTGVYFMGYFLGLLIRPIIKERNQGVESEQLESVGRATKVGTGRPSKSQFKLWQAPEAE
ncbi:uncharacterized protein N7484_005376 [Penicillium longicatenatum]|uniref:uncharacterized protein n=1 Tax=Penicillium longicatenatum TaxID=1561947 RepID=UPI00254805E3|nr:uncharacterized protein N7484_005376 [Penicillium longicatenatum]KAJ5642869.1 hypothetical protein N7484_005376 [Penicillium longicatenatum]